MVAIIECNGIFCELIIYKDNKMHNTKNINIIKNLVNQFTSATDMIGHNNYLLRFKNNNEFSKGIN